ncbi:unnamed protein product, partial [Symbiodinium natans]
MARFSKYDSNPKAWIDLQSEERSLAIAKWQRIILVEPLAFGLARDFHASKAAGLGTGPFLNSVADALAVKATSTLHSRANALMRYVAWASGKTAIVFPAAEPLVYAYFDDVKDKAAPTSLKSVLSAFAFAKYVVGLKGVDEILESGRVRGLAARLFLQKRKLLQRNPLKVEHVALLERICCGLEGRSLQDRMAAGFFLFLVHARARFSDAQRVCKLLFVRLISAYLEVHVSRSKTSFSLERKVRFLPMAACALGLSGLRWADAWIDVMEECGIRIHEDSPLLPCPGSNGTWRNVPLPCDQACVWLRSLLAQGVGPDEYLNNVGYHTSKSAGVGTELIYEVDAQSAPLRAMASMLREVRSGKFMPDNPRGQQLAEECERSDEEDPPHSEDDMASSSGSSVDEEERDHSVGLEEADVAALKRAGITTLARVAFMSSYTPGSGDDKELIAAFETALGGPASLGQKAAFRRLFHESFAVTTSEMRSLVERTDETAPRKLSVPERSERFAAIVKKLPGLDIRNRMEPSDALVDACVAIYEQNRLQYLEWDRLTSKEHEAQTSAKRESVLSIDSSGKLKTEKPDPGRADTSSEFLIHLALSRRGIAFEMANLLDFVHHSRWVEKLLSARLDVVPSSHNLPTFMQLQAADRKLFQCLADQTRAGLQVTASGRPLDQVFEAATCSTEVVSLMQPLPKAAGAGSEKERNGPYGFPPPPPGGKGRGKGKRGKAAVRQMKMPQGLEGCRSHTNGGDPICFGYGTASGEDAVFEPGAPVVPGVAASQ